MRERARDLAAVAARGLLVVALAALVLVALAYLTGSGIARGAGTVAWAAALGGALCSLVRTAGPDEGTAP